MISRLASFRWAKFYYVRNNIEGESNASKKMYNRSISAGYVKIKNKFFLSKIMRLESDSLSSCSNRSQSMNRITLVIYRARLISRWIQSLLLLFLFHALPGQNEADTAIHNWNINIEFLVFFFYLPSNWNTFKIIIKITIKGFLKNFAFIYRAPLQ